MRKNIIISFLSILMVLVLFVGCSSQNENVKTSFSNEEIETSVKNVLYEESLKYIKDSKTAECPAEGHIIMGYDKTKHGYKVYTLTMCGAYGFENGNFVNVSGTGEIPAVIYFDSELNFTNIEYPQDGEDYSKSIKKMLPKIYEHRALSQNENDFNELQNQQEAYAEKYLKEIGRDAKIGEYIDFSDSYKFLTDVGISVEVSSLILETFDKQQEDTYPYKIGNCEMIDDGVRYVLSTEYDEENNEVIYSKTVYDTNETVAKFVFDSKTGNQIE